MAASKTEDTGSKSKTSKSDGQIPKYYLIDYDGVIARPPGQDAVKHTSTPLDYPWPEAGRLNLVLHPGFNRIEGEHWHFYGVLDANGEPGEGKPQIAPMLRSGEVKVLDGLPRRDEELRALIERSCHKPSLRWMRDYLERNAGKYFDGARHEDRASKLIEAIDKRLASSNYLDYEPQPYNVRVPGVSKAPTMGAGMG